MSIKTWHLVLAVILFFASLGAWAKPAKKPTYGQLKVIYTVALQYGIDANDLIRVAYVESKFDQKAVRVNTNSTTDVGMFQVNSVHWNTTCQGLNVFTLKGNAECAARLILTHRVHAQKDAMWLGRYHSKTPSLKSKYFEKLESVPMQVLAKGDS